MRLSGYRLVCVLWRDRQPDFLVADSTTGPATRFDVLVCRQPGAYVFAMRLPHVDPHSKRGPLYRANVRLAQSRFGQAYAHRFGPRLDPWLYRVTRGLYPRITGSIVSAPLTTVGAKTGQLRDSQLAYFHDGADVVLVASNYGGPRHPQWYYNLKAHPNCELGGERFIATQVCDADEYDRLFGLAELVYPGFRDYRRSTESVGRRIPLFRLRPA
jgi:deazaflavin-dependent oxidoreductase (nitroreductase family)